MTRIVRPTLLLLLLVVVVMVTLTAAQQQSRSQQQQQQQQLQQQGTTPPPGDLRRLKSDARIEGMDYGHLNRFLGNEDSVKMLTNCFIDYASCKSDMGKRLINQVRALGTGGSCKHCTAEEQEHLHEMIYNFILGYQNKYPRYWRQVVLAIPDLLTTVARQ